MGFFAVYELTPKSLGRFGDHPTKTNTDFYAPLVLSDQLDLGKHHLLGIPAYSTSLEKVHNLIQQSF
jgi:hypothetical protein